MGIISGNVIAGVGDPGSRIAIVAHPDDDLLFMSRDIQAQLDDPSKPMTVVYTTTSGAREDGAKAAYSAMTGLSAWQDETIVYEADGVEYSIASSYLVDRPNVRLYFLRLPDGGTTGDGSAESLEKLWMDEIAQPQNGGLPLSHSTDGANGYTRDGLVALLREVYITHSPETIMTLDAYSQYRPNENSDHVHTSYFAMMAHQQYDTPHEFDAYIGYSNRLLTKNVEGTEYSKAREAFFAYAEHDPNIPTEYPTVNHKTFESTLFHSWLQSHHQVDGSKTYWSVSYGYNIDFTSDTGIFIENFYKQGGWRAGQHERMLADVNGDSVADFIGLGQYNTIISTSNRFGFNESRIGSTEISVADGWLASRDEAEMGDVNGDGMADMVIFGENNTSVALSNGRGFDSKQAWTTNFSHNVGGWLIDIHDREVGDANGDGKEDIIGFGQNGVWVALSNGNSFGAALLWNKEKKFTVSEFDASKHVREVGDLNDDGRADIVLFLDDGVYASLSNGAGFDASSRWIANFGYSAGGWRVDKNDRFLADVNGDGRDDIVGFGTNGVIVALSTGTGFGAARNWADDFVFKSANWDETKWMRDLADVNGDGHEDVVWTDDYGVRVALSTGSDFEIVPFDELTL